MVRSLLRLITLLVLPVALITGCVADSPPTPTPTTPPAPRFASDEEALAAAEEAYGAYLAVSDQVIRDGGVGVERLREFLSEELFAAEKADMERLQADGLRGVGFTTFTLTLQRHDHQSLSAYVCDDQTQSDLLDSAGNSVVNPEGLRRIAFELEFDPSDEMRMTRKDQWNGGGVC